MTVPSVVKSERRVAFGPKVKTEATVVQVKREPKTEPSTSTSSKLTSRSTRSRNNKQSNRTNSVPAVAQTQTFKNTNRHHHSNRSKKKKHGKHNRKSKKHKQPQPTPQLPLAENSSQLPPWLLTPPSCTHDPYLEAVDYARFCDLTPEERSNRDAIVSTITQLAKQRFPESATHLFGSYATGLHIPGSDIDLVITGGNLKGMTKTVRTQRGFATNVMPIKKARVPILKFNAIVPRGSSGRGPGGFSIDNNNNSQQQQQQKQEQQQQEEKKQQRKTECLERIIQCDVSFDHISGLDAVTFVRQAIIDYPEARPIFLVAKTLLRQHQLNDVCFGGLGSFTLFNMVISHLQQWQNNFSNIVPLSLKSKRLLESFFTLYGTNLSVTTIGISTRDGGSYYDRATRYPDAKMKGQGISVEDPTLTTNELGTNCYKLGVIRKLFEDAAKALREWSVNKKDTATTPLSALLKITGEMKRRRYSVVETLKTTLKEELIVDLRDALNLVDGVVVVEMKGMDNMKMDTNSCVWCQRTVAQKAEGAQQQEVVVLDDSDDSDKDEITVLE